MVLPVGFLINIFVIMPYWFPAFGEGMRSLVLVVLVGTDFQITFAFFFSAWVIRVSCFAVLAFNVYMNWYKMIKIGPSGRNPALPNVVKAGFRWASAYVYLAFLLLGYVSGSASFPSTSLGKRNFSVR